MSLFNKEKLIKIIDFLILWLIHLMQGWVNPPFWLPRCSRPARPTQAKEQGRACLCFSPFPLVRKLLSAISMDCRGSFSRNWASLFLFLSLGHLSCSSKQVEKSHCMITWKLLYQAYMPCWIKSTISGLQFHQLIAKFGFLLFVIDGYSYPMDSLAYMHWTLNIHLTPWTYFSSG